MKAKEAWYRLSEDEQKELTDKIWKNLEEVGAKIIIRMCDCYWSDQEWGIFGVLEFPEIEAVQKQAEFYNEIEWPRYAEVKTYLGTGAE